MFGGNAESHTTEHCNKKNLMLGLLDGHKKKQFDRAKKEELHNMSKTFKKALVKGKKACKRSYHDSSESDSSLKEECFTFNLTKLGDNSLT
eukprot:4548547-Ditylum_brightwellii.AAC.1